MQLNEAYRIDLISRRMDQAYEVMEVADIMIAHNKFSSAARHILFGALSAIKALSLKYNRPTDNHNKMIRWFHMEIIRNGLIEREYGRIFRHMQKVNLRGDYDKFTRFEKENLSQMLKGMMRLVIEIDSHISTV